MLCSVKVDWERRPEYCSSASRNYDLRYLNSASFVIPTVWRHDLEETVAGEAATAKQELGVDVVVDMGLQVPQPDLHLRMSFSYFQSHPVAYQT